MKKVSVVLEVTSLNFYWSEKGFKYADGTPVRCSWDDISFQIFCNGKNLYGKLTTHIDTILYIEHEISELYGDLGKKMEESYPGYIEEELNNTSYGIPMKNIAMSKDILFAYCYSDENDEDPYETSLLNAPINDKGEKPSYIFGFVPVQNLNKKAVEDFMAAYVRKHGIDGECEIEFEWENVPEDEYLKEQFQSELDLIKQSEEMRARGEKYKICYAPIFLKQIFGENRIQPLIGRGLVSGEPLGDYLMGGDILLRFEDGHTELLRDEEDHFSPPELPND